MLGFQTARVVREAPATVGAVPAEVPRAAAGQLAEEGLVVMEVVAGVVEGEEEEVVVVVEEAVAEEEDVDSGHVMSDSCYTDMVVDVVVCVCR